LVLSVFFSNDKADRQNDPTRDAAAADRDTPLLNDARTRCGGLSHSGTVLRPVPFAPQLLPAASVRRCGRTPNRDNKRARGNPNRMVDDLEQVMKQRRSLEKALAELEARYDKRPSDSLARMIEQLKAELVLRKQRS
jgi:hypothetical protein